MQCSALAFHAWLDENSSKETVTANNEKVVTCFVRSRLWPGLLYLQLTPKNPHNRLEAYKAYNAFKLSSIMWIAYLTVRWLVFAVDAVGNSRTRRVTGCGFDSYKRQIFVCYCCLLIKVRHFKKKAVMNKTDLAYKYEYVFIHLIACKYICY